MPVTREFQVPGDLIYTLGADGTVHVYIVGDDGTPSEITLAEAARADVD